MRERVFILSSPNCPEETPKQAEQTFVEWYLANEETRHVAQLYEYLGSSGIRSGVCVFGNARRLRQESKEAVTVVVICDDAAAQKMIRESLLSHFHPPVRPRSCRQEWVQLVNRLRRKNG